MVEWRWGGCSAGRVLEMKVWKRWWRTDCCWSPAGSAREGGPSGAGMDAHNTNYTLLYFRWHPQLLHLTSIYNRRNQVPLKGKSGDLLYGGKKDCIKWEERH